MLDLNLKNVLILLVLGIGLYWEDMLKYVDTRLITIIEKNKQTSTVSFKQTACILI